MVVMLWGWVAHLNLLADHLGGFFVIAQPGKGGMTEQAIGCPFGEPHFGDELRLLTSPGCEPFHPLR
jgi:hypothetical protein